MEEEENQGPGIWGGRCFEGGSKEEEKRGGGEKLRGKLGGSLG